MRLDQPPLRERYSASGNPRGQNVGRRSAGANARYVRYEARRPSGVVAAAPIARMRRTLDMAVIEGVKTTIPLHLRILQDPDFVAGKLSTSFMERFNRTASKGKLAEAV